MNEFEALEQAYQKECFKLDALAVAIREIEAQGIARDTVVALEEYCPELVSGDYPLASYTHFPSETNLGFAMENLATRVIRTLFTVLRKVIEIWLKINQWLFDKIIEFTQYVMESKWGDRSSSFMDDVMSMWRSEQANASIETYTRNARSLLCQFIEDKADTLVTGESLFEAVTDINLRSTEIVELIVDRVAEVRKAVKGKDSAAIAGAPDDLIKDTASLYESIWMSDINDYGEAVDDYAKKGPSNPHVSDMKRQLKDFITIGYPDPPKAIEVMQSRLNIVDYLKNNDRTSQGSPSKIEKLHRLKLFDNKTNPRLEKAYRASAVELNGHIESLLEKMSDLPDLAKDNVDVPNIQTFMELVRKGTSTLMRFAKLAQHTVVFQSRINEGRATIVKALDAALEEHAKYENSKKKR